MKNVSTIIHLTDEKPPEVVVANYGGFTSVKIILRGKDYTHSDVLFDFFFYSKQDVTNFKNNLLWAFENPTRRE